MLRSQVASEGPFVVGEGILGMTLSVVTRGPFPSKQTVVLNRCLMMVALRWRRRRRGTQQRILTRWNDHLGATGMPLNGIVDRLLIIDAIGDKTVNFPLDLGPELRHLSWVLLMTISYTSPLIWPSSSTPMCSFSQRLRFFSPCFWACHSPWPHPFNPVLSTIKDIGPWGAQSTYRRIATVALRLDIVV